MKPGSILSFPDRGPYGDGKYRGNCSGYVVKSLLEHYGPRLFVDPCEGSKTSRDVCAKHFPGIEYFGFDLSSGFNLVRDRLLERLPRRCDYLFFHPCYGRMVLYSGNVWGTPQPDDLSRCSTATEFLDKMQMCLINIFDAVRAGGHFSVLIGDVRRKGGEYWSIQSDIIKVAPGRLEGILIKEQHNTQSSRELFSDSFFPITHEYILNFTKDRTIIGILDYGVRNSQHLSALSNGTWKAVINFALQNLGGEAALSDIYSEVEREASAKTKANPHFKDKVRQVLQRHFRSVQRGVWALPAANC